MARPSKFAPIPRRQILTAVYAGSTIEACHRASVKRTTLLGWVQRQGLRAVLDEAKAAGSLANSKIPAGGPETKPKPAARPESLQPVQPAQVLEKPEIKCVWTANLAAAEVLVEIAGAVLDGLRANFRARGLLQ